MSCSMSIHNKIVVRVLPDGRWSGEDDEVLVPGGIILIELRETILLILYP